MNILFYDICFSTLFFSIQLFPFPLFDMLSGSLFCLSFIHRIFFIIHAFCSLSIPPFCHPLHLVISSGSLTVPFITVCYPQHMLLRDTLTLSCLPPTSSWYPPHMYIFLQMLLVALGLGWDKRKRFSPVPIRIWICMWSVCCSDKDQCTSIICKVHWIACG